MTSPNLPESHRILGDKELALGALDWNCLFGPAQTSPIYITTIQSVTNGMGLVSALSPVG